MFDGVNTPHYQPNFTPYTQPDVCAGMATQQLLPRLLVYYANLRQRKLRRYPHTAGSLLCRQKTCATC